MISILILTKNEERDLPGCLDSVAWSDDVHVLDSYSLDGTVEVARARGAIVTQRAFDDWSTHQNWALSNLAFKYGWVFYLDADERVTPRLADSLRSAVGVQAGHVAYTVRRRDFFLGRWLKHVQATPYYVRLFRPGSVRYERLVNPVTVVEGSCGRLEGYLDHYPFSKGIDFWFDRHNRYSRLEAEQIMRDREGSEQGAGSIVSRDPQQRRRALKRLFYRMPCRPLLKFLWLYLYKGGFLDGRAGLLYATMVAVYEQMIVVKVQVERHGPP